MLLEGEICISQDNIWSDTNVNADYTVYTIIVDVGNLQDFGHYYAFIKNLYQLWCKRDNEIVTKVDIDIILNEKAYILFYIKKKIPRVSGIFILRRKLACKNV